MSPTANRRRISHLRIRYQVPDTVLAPGAIATEILYSWVEDGEPRHALTRLRHGPSLPTYEHRAFLTRNNMVEL